MDKNDGQFDLGVMYAIGQGPGSPVSDIEVYLPNQDEHGASDDNYSSIMVRPLPALSPGPVGSSGGTLLQGMRAKFSKYREARVGDSKTRRFSWLTPSAWPVQLNDPVRTVFPSITAYLWCMNPLVCVENRVGMASVFHSPRLQTE